MDIANAKEVVVTNVVPLLIRIVGAIVLWIAGRWLTRMVRRVLQVAGKARHLDTTLQRYVDSAANVVLTVLLMLAALSIFGVETTSFAGVIAATGVAIGMAWSGLLSNFAAGVFILGLQPFRVGDHIGVAGVTGSVQEIGMFNTAIDTGDNVRTWIGNARIFADNIQNFSTNGWRRVEVKVAVPAGVDLLAALVALREVAAKVPEVLKEPAPSTDVAAVDGNGVISVRVAAPTARHAAVVSDLNRSVALWLKHPGAAAAAALALCLLAGCAKEATPVGVLVAKGPLPGAVEPMPEGVAAKKFEAKFDSTLSSCPATIFARWWTASTPDRSVISEAAVDLLGNAPNQVITGALERTEDRTVDTQKVQTMRVKVHCSVYPGLAGNRSDGEIWVDVWSNGRYRLPGAPEYAMAIESAQ